jgi:hypothetical protein
MTASETQTPVIAFPVPSSTSWQISAFYSMIDMPPWIPNWFQANQESIVDSITNFAKLKESGSKPTIWIPKEIANENKILKEILKHYNLASSAWEADLWIQLVDVSSNELNDNVEKPKVRVVIPTLKEPETFETMWKIFKNTTEVSWLLMGRNLKSKINPDNALIYLAQLLCSIDSENTELLNFLEDYRKWLTSWASVKDNKTLKNQLV